MIKVLKKNTIQELRKTFSKEKGILAVYIFGSQAGGFAGPKSDLDLAVFVSDKKKISERQVLKLLLKSKTKIPFEVDLSCVDFSSLPVLLFQIIKNGACIYEKDLLQRIGFEAKAMHLYYHNQQMRNTYKQYLQKSLKEGTYGY